MVFINKNKYKFNQKNIKIKLIDTNIIYINNKIKNILNIVKPKDKGNIIFQPKNIN